MHILIFDIGFQEKVKNYFLFSAIFAYFLTFYPKNPKHPNRQSANMAQNVSDIMFFQMRYVCKNPPGGGRNPYQLIDYIINIRIWYVLINFFCSSISLSGRDMSRNVLIRFSWSYIVDMWIPSNIVMSPSPNYNKTFWVMIIYIVHV